MWELGEVQRIWEGSWTWTNVNPWSLEWGVHCPVCVPALEDMVGLKK